MEGSLSFQVRSVLLKIFPPSYRWGTWGSEGLSDLAHGPEPGKARASTWSQVLRLWLSPRAKSRVRCLAERSLTPCLGTGSAVASSLFCSQADCWRAWKVSAGQRWEVYQMGPPWLSGTSIWTGKTPNRWHGRGMCWHGRREACHLPELAPGADLRLPPLPHPLPLQLGENNGSFFLNKADGRVERGDKFEGPALCTECSKQGAPLLSL